MNTRILKPVIKKEILDFIESRKPYDIITISDIARNTARTNHVIAKYINELELEDKLYSLVVFKLSEGIRKMVRRDLV